MEQSVLRAMKKWPHVKAVFGWIQLDLRGRWLLGGRPIDMPQSIDFINANYSSDEQGRWFFQNGPQRVFVTLSYTPMVYKFSGHELVSHTNQRVHQLRQVLVDEAGSLILDTELGPGIMIDRDLTTALTFFSIGTQNPLLNSCSKVFWKIQAPICSILACWARSYRCIPFCQPNYPSCWDSNRTPGKYPKQGRDFRRFGKITPGSYLDP